MRSLILLVALVACDGGSFRTGGGSGQSPRLAIANGYAYWFSGPRLVKTRLDLPNDPSSIALTKGGADGNVHVNAQYAYWREIDEIHRVPIDASQNPVTIGATTAGGPANLALDEENLFYPRDTSVVRQSVATGAETIILSDRAATSLALDGDVLVGTSCEAGIDASWRISIDGGDATRISERGCGELAAVDNSFVYTFEVTNQRPGIVRVPKAGGAPVVLFETTSNVFAVSEGFVYAVSADDEIVRFSAAGDAPTVLARGAALGLAVDNGILYWTSRSDFPAGVVLSTLALPQ